MNKYKMESMPHSPLRDYETIVYAALAHTHQRQSTA